MMNGGLQLNQDTSGDESDEPGDSASLALIEQILLSGDLSIPKNLIPQEIEEEVDDAIDDVLDDTEDDADSLENTVDDADVKFDSNSSEISAYHSANITSYWQMDDETSLNPYYEKEADAEYSGNTEAYIAEETKQFNTAVKENYNARIKNELGLEFQDEELSEQEKSLSYTFKIMNPSLWKFMYEASSYLVSGKTTTC